MGDEIGDRRWETGDGLLSTPDSPLSTLSTVIWDFDGTLVPNDPYDSEQSLMIHKLYHAGQKIPF